MAKQQIQLKRSRLALLFQLMVGSVIVLLLAQVLATWLWLCCCLILGGAYFKFLKSNRILSLDQLDEHEWSIAYFASQAESQHIKILRKTTPQQTEIRRVQLRQVVDHQIYIVLYFQKALKPAVIWCDQVSAAEWKVLKVLAKVL
ncbi:MAG: hypothetical protein GX151_01930 [Gammaproteobacteria bacterium]|nr:hypothetical protein [Gammaproteobacteria bacterium]